MKSFLTILFILAFLSGFTGFSQDRVTGPEAKFKGIRKASKAPVLVYFTDHDHKTVKGPEAKNTFLREDDCEQNLVRFSRRKNLKGPRAKNTRPEDKDHWKKKDGQ